MRPLLTISILLFAAPFLLYFCDPGHPVIPDHPYPHIGYNPGPFNLELEDFEISCWAHDKDGRVGPRPDRLRVEKTDVFNMRILLEDSHPWTLALLRNGGEAYGFPAAMACSVAPPTWIETDPPLSVDIFMVDPLAMDTISVSKHLRLVNPPSANATYDITYPKSYVRDHNPKVEFTLELLRTEDFPESAYFFGEALFSSGRILESSDTPEYSFQ